MRCTPRISGVSVTQEPDLYQTLADTLIEERGWDHAVFLVTAVRGYVYGSPNPGPYRDEAEAIYKRLGWEQSALLASWFRDARNRPDTRPKKRPSGRRPGGWPAAALPKARTAETKESP